MIQFNLLPDVKMEYIRAQRVRRLVVSASLLVSALSILVLVLLLSVDGLQRKHLNDLQRDIKSETAVLQGKPNINTILTVQNQLQSLTALHNGKPAATRLFDYLNQLTPASVAITTFSIDYTQYTVSVTGTADSLSSVNQFVDTLKLTNYSTSGSSGTNPAFSNVVLSAFSLNTGTTDASQAANYTITVSYDKSIFDITQKITLNVPTVTTRAQIQNPSDLFKGASGGNH